jgi:hypothetical protein
LQRWGRIAIAALFVSVAGFQVGRTAIVNDDLRPE